jgi:hypothetical protein
MTWSLWLQHRVLHGVLATVVGTALPVLVWAGVDYDPASKDWNGLSSLVDTAAKADVVVTVQSELNWSTLTEEEVLLLLSPNKPPSGGDRQQLLRFLQAGGRVIVADDFRSGNEWLQGLGLALGEAPVAEPGAQPTPGWQGNTAWPQVEVIGPTNAPRPAWLRDTARYAPTEFLAHNLQQPLVLNHPASVAAAGPRGQQAAVWGLYGPGWAVPDGAGWLAETGVEGGRLLVLADPSVLVNAMLGRFHDNRQFAANLLRYYCVQERPCTVRAVSGDIRTTGEFTPARSQRTPGFRAGLEQLADWLLALSDLAKGPLVQPALLLVLLAALGLPVWLRARLGPPQLPPPLRPPRHASLRAETITRWLQTVDADYRKPARLLATHLARWLERLDRLPTTVADHERSAVERLPEGTALVATQQVLRDRAGWSPQALARLEQILADLRRAAVDDGPPVSKLAFSKLAADVEWAETLLRHTTSGPLGQPLALDSLQGGALRPGAGSATTSELADIAYLTGPRDEELA